MLNGMGRVTYGICGAEIETTLPWCKAFTSSSTYACFLATRAKPLSWKDVAEVFHTTWEKLFRSM